MLSVVCSFWMPKPSYRSQFRAPMVNVLRAMVARHYPDPHRFICVTDAPDGLDPSIEVVPAWNDYADLQSPYGPRNPSCYRRLRYFHPDIGSVLGPRFVHLDLDTVIVGDLRPLWNRPEDFVIWGETDPRSHYNGSMWLMTAGARPQVWTKFDPRTSPRDAHDAGRFGSDQGWMSYILGPSEARWRTTDGVYSFRVHLKPYGRVLPPDARVVMFHGGTDPWSEDAQRIEWVRQHWRADEEPEPSVGTPLAVSA